jgi:hypothetical protein
MNPLFDKFFHRELTDAEERDLDAMLKDSEDAAWDFGLEAEENYLRYGLPEPRPPRPGGWGSLMSAANPWVLLLTLLVILAALGVFKKPASVPPVAAPVPAGKAAQAVKAIRGEAPPPAARMKVTGDNLEVVVKRETMGPVAVKVVDRQGAVIRQLFDGTLDQGRWSFQWDGRSQDGNLVEPGKYRIQVESEGSVQSREVRIR